LRFKLITAFLRPLGDRVVASPLAARFAPLLRVRGSHLRLLGEHQERLAVVGDRRFVDDHAREVGL
jgi:hypothetical protein